MNRKLSVKTSDDFKDDEDGAMKALDKTSIAIFMISNTWFDDVRAQKEWRYACEMKKPMIYLLKDPAKLLKQHNLRFVMEQPTLIGTLNIYPDNFEKMSNYLQAMIYVWEQEHEV